MVFAPQGKHTLSHRVFVTIFVCAMAVIVAFTVLGAFFVQNTLADARVPTWRKKPSSLLPPSTSSRSPSRSCVASIERTCASR